MPADGTVESLRDADLRHVWHPFQQASSYQSTQLIVSRGHGPYVIDDEGRRYLDAISGLWNVNLGYSEHRIVDAVCEQLRLMPFTSLIVASHEPAIRLASLLADRAPTGLDAVFFTSGGSEGIETAIKLARHCALARGQGHRRHIISLTRSYHGMSYGALSATGIPDDRWQFGTLLPDVQHVASPHTLSLQAPDTDESEICSRAVDEIERALSFHGPTSVAAILVEPVMGVAGMAAHPALYLERIRELCDRHGILLVFDEVATGFGRTGRLFAAELCGIRPDMIVLAKGLTAGYVPLGAVLVSRELVALCEGSPSAAFMHGFTYGGSPAGCVAAEACLSIIESEGLLAKVRSDGEQLVALFRKTLVDLPMVRAVRGTGLMIAIDLCPPVTETEEPISAYSARVRKVARERGLLVRTTYGGTTFNFAPPFICDAAQLKEIATTFADAVQSAYPH